MADSFDVEILYTDGTKEIVVNANEMHANDGVLRIFYNAPDRGIYFGKQTHLGSYPIRNIRRWRKVAK